MLDTVSVQQIFTIIVKLLAQNAITNRPKSQVPCMVCYTQRQCMLRGITAVLTVQRNAPRVVQEQWPSRYSPQVP